MSWHTRPEARAGALRIGRALAPLLLGALLGALADASLLDAALVEGLQRVLSGL